MAVMPDFLLPPDSIGLSAFHYGYGRAPERHYDILSSAVLSKLDLRGKGIIEFGAGHGNKLVIAAAKGARAALGLELPEVARAAAGSLETDLAFNFPAIPGLASKFRVVSRDIMLPGNLETGAMHELWSSQIGEGPPAVAVMSLGPHYDREMESDENPHVRAIELALRFDTVNTVVAGGYAREYKYNGLQAHPHYLESDQLARQMLKEYFKTVTVYELKPKGLQTIVASGRKK
jgi:hypothetical protein